jgi:arsenite-transporting ATPase
VTELEKHHINICNLVINQVVFPDPSSPCKLCNARKRVQTKYLNMFKELYSDYHLVITPLIDDEVRGVEKLANFSQLLIKPYNPS